MREREKNRFIIILKKNYLSNKKLFNVYVIQANYFTSNRGKEQLM